MLTVYASRLFNRPMRLHRVLLLLAASLAGFGCKQGPVGSSNVDAAARGMLADTGFRPNKDGFKFENQGGRYPRTPPVLTSQDVSRMFGSDVCVNGGGTTCRLKPVATEWMAMVNRAMNDGQCEGMAVSSLAFYKKLYQPSAFAPHAKSIHDLTHAETGPLIGYFWAYQMVNPVREDKAASLMSMTPNSAEDTLVDMLKRNELAVIAIRSPHGGHAVTPYAVEDRGNGIHWIDIYDNNWPDKERHIIIDRNANTWEYELASLNPDIPKEPWRGTADSHTIAVTPLSDRLSKAECPFCAGGKKLVVSYGTNGVTLTNGQGKKLGREGDKIVNEIPGAEVIEVASYLEGVSSGDPIYAVPADGDYQIAIAGREKPSHAESVDDDHGVAVIGNGAAVTVETPKLKLNEKDTLSIGHEGGIKYQTSKAGEFPGIRLAADGAGGGMHARLTHMNAEANDEIVMKLDHAAGQITVAGGGRQARSFDLKVTHVQAGAEDRVNEQKGIKFQPGMTHTIQSSANGPAGPSPFKVAMHVAPAVPPPPPGPGPLLKGAPAATGPAPVNPKGKTPLELAPGGSKGKAPEHPAPPARR